MESNSETKPRFMQVPIQQRENMLMPEILRCLRSLNGFATRQQVIDELKETSQKIPEDYIDYEKQSSDTGNFYKPFNYQFNFAMKHLNYADFIVMPKKGSMQLTEKGSTVKLEHFDSNEQVRKISNPLFEEKSQQKNSISKNPPIKNTAFEEVEPDEEVNPWEQELMQALKNMSPKKFEMFARELAKAMGIELEENIGTQYTNDGGIDGFGYKTFDDIRTARVAIQAKRWNAKITAPEIDKFRGAMDKHRVEYGIFITNSNFTKGAVKVSREGTRTITLVNGKRIAELVARYELYVTPVTTYVLDDFYYEKD